MSPLTPELVEQVLALRGSGLTLSQIGAKVGRPKTTVQNICARHSTVTVPTAALPRPAFYADCAGPGACSWPLSAGRPWRFCSEPRYRGGVYCAEHMRAATGGRSWHAEPQREMGGASA